MAARISIGVLLALGVAVLAAWGLQAFAVFAFFAVIAGGAAFAAGVGGGWLTGASSGRFRDHDRDR
jgi:hypothetical protein